MRHLHFYSHSGIPRQWLRKGCVKVSDSFGSEVNEKLLNLALQSSDRTFSLGQVQDDVGSLAVNLSRIRSAIRRMDREFKLELVDVDTFVGLSLSGVDEVEQDCLAVVAKHNPTYNPEALAFLYSVIVFGLGAFIFVVRRERKGRGVFNRFRIASTR